ncbi:MAG TPA: NAD(P)-dependent oxidoreductase [Leptospiraceae bacterium]|nr:short-chain dehydrogenase [Spirochaetaceae bacterium]HBS04352.1 NAD(P)-dependent oxidoreductase [Leptospiraceae bacterium]|tara:strand:+ start:2340 stop:3059 length:720 start_codon:yes stop_codon:yes gene_type:complete
MTTPEREKVILVTGATRGIGHAIAENLANAYPLIITGRSTDALNALKNKLTDAGGKVEAIAADLTSSDDIKNLVESSIRSMGRIDCLINNAGMGIFGRVDEIQEDDFRYVMELNLMAPYQLTKAVLPDMISRKSGQIINISSVAGLNGFKGGGAYAASKFALNGFTESLREDVKEFGIAVTAVCPGGVRTEFGGNPASVRDFVLEPQDVAHTVRYLVDESETANTKLIELKPRRRSEFR